MELTAEISKLKGIGAKKAEQLGKLGIYTIYDLLTHFPRSYEDPSAYTSIYDLAVGEKQTVCGAVTAVQERQTGGRGGRRLSIINASISDGTGSLQVTWFNQKYLKKTLRPGTRIMVTGKVEYAYGGRGAFAMSHLTDFQILSLDDDQNDEDEKARQVTRIQPVYPSTGYLNQKFFRKEVQLALESVNITELIPESIRQRYGLMPRTAAFYQIHFPDNVEESEIARHRLAFEELYLIQCGLMLMKKRSRDEKQGIVHDVNGLMLQDAMAQLPFKLTGDQQKAWQDICHDMESRYPMRRLLQGDVGSGKTVIALLALVKTVENGCQGALMAPTEILASQHFDTFKQLLSPLGLRVELLTGHLTQKRRLKIYENLANHSIDIIIGTHALIEEGVTFANLGLVITDEQHRFGIQQRARLEEKGEYTPDVLVMTATPIPRTMALTVYGDLDVSLIRELPPGRKTIRTFVRTPDRREPIYKFMLEQVKQGRQGYVVCPLISSESADDSCTIGEHRQKYSAEDVFEELSTGIFSDIRCGLVHGRMKAAEKEAVMEAFYAGEIKILVATTVIEVGVNVPNATMMVVEQADQFGLAQLHQLRGRIGRGQFNSYCVLVASGKSDNAKERMKLLETVADGFILAEEDLKLRGPGQIFGIMQHGLGDLRIASVLDDVDILMQARQASIETMSSQQDLQQILPVLLMQYQSHFEKITNV